LQSRLFSIAVHYNYGPMHKACAALEASQQANLFEDIATLLGGLNVGGPNSLVVPSEYLEVVIAKQ
jgi:hypothetical protein